MKRIEINDYVVADPEICHGKPTFKDTRVMVWQVLEMLEEGASTEEILEAFPALTAEHITAALNYATSLTKSGDYVIIRSEVSA